MKKAEQLTYISQTKADIDGNYTMKFSNEQGEIIVKQLNIFDLI